MTNRTASFITVILVFLLTGCATVEDVRRATDLMRTDNELTRLLVEVRPSDQAGASTYLNGLAIHAKDQADSLKDTPGKLPDAIAYYRIASTAYWRSGNPDAVNSLFEVTNSGDDLCEQLGDQAPDRDCLFLKLVIPFAGLESNAKEKNLSGLLESVDFNDGNASTDDIRAMREIRNSLNQTKLLIEKIFAIGANDRVLSHSGMREYYCRNSNQAFGYYDATAAIFATKVREFNANIPNPTTPLEITLSEASELRQLRNEVPAFCR